MQYQVVKPIGCVFKAEKSADHTAYTMFICGGGRKIADHTAYTMFICGGGRGMTTKKTK